MNDADGQAARARQRILAFWECNRGPLTGAFSIIDAYLALFGDVFPELTRDGIGYDFIPKATSANAVYAALEQVRGIGIDASSVPPLPQTGTAEITYGPEKLGISLWNAVGRAMHYRRAGLRRLTVVVVSDGELQSNIDAAARLAGAKRLRDLLVLVDVNGLQSCYPVSDVDLTLTPGAGGQLPLARIWADYGWSVHDVDGHSRPAVAAAVRDAMAAEKPGLVLLRTVKGKGLAQIEGQIGRYNHGVDDRLHAVLRVELAQHASQYPAPAPGGEFDAGPAAAPARRELIVERALAPVRTTRASQVLKQWLETVCRLNPHTVHVINSDTSYPFDPQLDPGETRTDLSQCAGINEIGAFNLARGVSQSGGYPIYVSPGVHLECCSDEFRLAGLHQDPMLVVGFNTGSYLGHWGPTYVSRRDLETYRAPGVDIVQPATTGDLTSVLNALPASARPTYLRLPHRLLDFPAAREACVSDGLYRMTAATQHPEDVVIVATGMAVPVALAAAQALTRVGRECAVLNVVRLTRLDPATLSQHIGKAPYLCVLVDGETTSLELSVRKSSAVDQLVTAIDLSERQLSASEWWLRNPIDHTGHVLDEIMAVLLSMQ